MGHFAEEWVTSLLMGVIAALYATVGQSGGTAFVAVMALMALPPDEIQPTSLALNIMASSYATWRLHRAGLVNWRAFRLLMPTSLPASCRASQAWAAGSFSPRS